MPTIPLLPAPVNLYRDASRSSQRIRQKEKCITRKTLDTLVHLPEFTITHFSIEQRREESILHLYGKHNYDYAICPQCKSVSESIHQEKPRCVRDLDISKHRTFLHFISRRFSCEHCKHTFVERLQSIGFGHRQTERFQEVIYQRSLSSTHKSVAKEMWLDPSTVKTIFLRLAKDKLDEENQRDVKKLAMDEIALKKRHKQFALVISDLERHCVIAVLPSRDKESLELWLSNLSASKRKAIEIVSIDMWRPYFYAVKAKLPHARVIADRFHVVKQLNENITKLRRTTQRKSDKKVNEILKGSRWLLVKNRQNLSPKEEIHLQKVLGISPEIREAYLLKEEFRNIFEKIKNVEQAKRFLAVWILKAQKTGSRYLAKFVRTLQNWWEEILRYFEEGITNAFSEGINRAIRSIINRAYGYRNFDNFRLQVLAQHGYAHSHHANSR